MRYRYLFSCIFSLVVAASLLPGRAQAASLPLDLDAVDAHLRAQMAANHLPGMAVALVKDGQVLMLRGYGEARPGQPVTPQTQFYLGSLTKSFTALAVMQ